MGWRADLDRSFLDAVADPEAAQTKTPNGQVFSPRKRRSRIWKPLWQAIRRQQFPVLRAGI